jgi:hypothetical protein
VKKEQHFLPLFINQSIVGVCWSSREGCFVGEKLSRLRDADGA